MILDDMEQWHDDQFEAFDQGPRAFSEIQDILQANNGFLPELAED